MSVQKIALNILKRGDDYSKQQKYTEAVVCYKEGLAILAEMCEKDPSGAADTKYAALIIEYKKKTEIASTKTELEKVNRHHYLQHRVLNNTKGQSYKKIFGNYLDADVNSVVIEDPYIRTPYQCQNFVALTELLVESCKNLTKIDLVTARDCKADAIQKDFFQKLILSLHKCNVILTIKYSHTLHDRQIMLSNGWLIKIGRGLDYFKRNTNEFALGAFDMDLRLCQETNIDIIYTLKTSE